MQRFSMRRRRRRHSLDELQKRRHTDCNALTTLNGHFQTSSDKWFQRMRYMMEGGAKAFAKFTSDLTADELTVAYQGLFVAVHFKFDPDDDDESKKPNENEKSPKDTFKIHDGFTYNKEMKIA